MRGWDTESGLSMGFVVGIISYPYDMKKLLRVANKFAVRRELMGDVWVEREDEEDGDFTDPLPGKPLWKDEPHSPYQRADERVKERVKAMSLVEANRILHKMYELRSQVPQKMIESKNWRRLEGLIEWKINEAEAFDADKGQDWEIEDWDTEDLTEEQLSLLSRS